MPKHMEVYAEPSGMNVYAVEWWPTDTPTHVTSYVVAPHAGAAIDTISQNPADIKSLINLGGALIWAAGAKPARLTPKEIRDSVTPDFITSFEDGKKYKSMKSHLRLRGMTPEAYREKWGLPVDYPIVAKSYSLLRSRLAKDTGLGTNGVSR